MNLNQLKTIYLRSPLFLKKIYSSIPFEFRAGKEYRKLMNELNANQIPVRNPWTTVDFAINNFSFYKKKYNLLRPEKWEEIPLLTKTEIQQNISEFESLDMAKFYVTTGGVTGKPAMFFQSNNVWSKELAFVNSYFLKFGYKPGILKASFRGGDFSALKKDQIWKKNPIYNEMHFSPYHMNFKTIAKYVSELDRHKPLYFHGYPSSFVTLAKLMKRKKISLSYRPRCFFLISENYSSKDVDFLQEFFGSQISSFYGHSERLIFATANDDLSSYKPDLRYGYFELIDGRGNVITEEGVEGEIVGTSYDNYAMPLIRYKTGDFTYYTDFKTKTFARLQGKWGQNFLIGINGEKISLTALNLHSPELNSFIRTQFIIKEKGVVEMKVVSSSILDQREILQIQNLLSNRVGNLIKFRIDLVENLIINERGKAPLIINK